MRVLGAVPSTEVCLQYGNRHRPHHSQRRLENSPSIRNRQRKNGKLYQVSCRLARRHYLTAPLGSASNQQYYSGLPAHDLTLLCQSKRE